MDKNYWKEAYKEYWEISSKKEIFVKELIESGKSSVSCPLKPSDSAPLC